jgi:quercetin 2,3-dioxygenase
LASFSTHCVGIDANFGKGGRLEVVSGPVSTDTEVDTHDASVDRPVFERHPGRQVDLGGLAVRRLLPRRAHRTVGAWCFVDVFGPSPEHAETPMRVGPHPHIGLQTVTWLVHGQVRHRDSLGSDQMIRPGQLNVMTAGRGVAHAEQSAGAPTSLLGAQLWVAQPDSTRHGPAAFEHHGQLPAIDFEGGTMTILVGSVSGATSPARTDTPLLGASIDSLAGGALGTELDPTFEHALVVLEGAVSIVGERVSPGELVYLGMGREQLEVAVDPGSHALLLGGEPFDDDLVMWWNFVARTRDEVATACHDWQTHADRFGRVDSELARIDAPPLPWED